MRAPPPTIEGATGLFVRVPEAARPAIELATAGAALLGQVKDLDVAIGDFFDLAARVVGSRATRRRSCARRRR